MQRNRLESSSHIGCASVLGAEFSWCQVSLIQKYLLLILSTSYVFLNSQLTWPVPDSPDLLLYVLF